MLLCTVGHGTLDQDALRRLLQNAGIDLLVDVRRTPGSRRHPHVNRDALARWLPEAGLDYRWEEALGGRRRRVADSPHVAIRDPSFRAYADHLGTAEFRDGLRRVLDEAAERTIAVMCAEAVWWRCHRRFIADAAMLLHGLAVHHLFHDGRLEPHRPTDGARVADDRIVYDVVAQPPLLEPPDAKR